LSSAKACSHFCVQPRESFDTTVEIPVNEYYEYFGPDYKLNVQPSNMEDLNSSRYLNRVLGIVSDNLRSLGGPPSVQMQGARPALRRCAVPTASDIPRVPAVDSLMDDPNEDEDLIPRDTRRISSMLDALVQPDGELSDSDDEGEGGRRDVASHREATEPTTESGSTGSGAEPMQTDSDSVVLATVTTARAPTGILGSAGGDIAPGGAGTVTLETVVDASTMQVDGAQPPASPAP
jgi:histone deacetylase 1/2